MLTLPAFRAHGIARGVAQGNQRAAARQTETHASGPTPAEWSVIRATGLTRWCEAAPGGRRTGQRLWLRQQSRMAYSPEARRAKKWPPAQPVGTANGGVRLLVAPATVPTGSPSECASASSVPPASSQKKYRERRGSWAGKVYPALPTPAPIRSRQRPIAPRPARRGPRPAGRRSGCPEATHPAPRPPAPSRTAHASWSR